MLSSPIGAVVATRDLPAAVDWFGRLGLLETASGALPADLYGGSGAFVDLSCTARGTVRLVEVGSRPAARGSFDDGPIALDFYSRDLARSLTALDVPAAAPVRIDLGPLVMHQLRLAGPDGLPVVLIDASSRRPSRLDDDETALHSEAHSLVWVVPSIDEALPFWQAAGLNVAFDVPITSPAVAELLELPRSDVAVRMAMLSDADTRPMRLELFEFPADLGAPFDPKPRAGAVWPAFEVMDLDAARRLPWQTVGPVHDVAGRAVSRCVAPGGVVVELWS